MLVRLFIAVLVAATFGQLGSSAAADSKRPNIVILYADDMGYGDLGVQNPDSKIPTPNLDRLASEGTRFTDAHSSSGICTPSRYAMLTGRFHWRKFHDIVNSFDPPVIDGSELTLADMLKSSGYRTGCIGKWHLGWNWKEIQVQRDLVAQMDAKGRNRIYAPEAFAWGKPFSGGPLSHGFESYFGDDVPNFPPYAWFRDDRVIDVPTERLAISGQPAEGSWEARPGPMTKGWDFRAVVPRLTEETVKWIGERKGETQPFFLYAPFNSPHAPIAPTEEFLSKSKTGGYGGFMTQTDDAVGQILKALEENGFADNTLVIFTADNGPERYAYNRLREFGHRSAGPLRGLKRDLYEGGHRVPMIVRWPGVVKAGATSDALVSQVDFLATIAAIIDYTLPADSAHDSYNLLPVWKDAAPSPRRTIVHNTAAKIYAVRHEQWVLIANKTGAHTPVPAWFDEQNGYVKHDQPGELYNLTDDLAQKKNLYADNPSKVEELSALLEKIRAKGQVR